MNGVAMAYPSIQDLLLRLINHPPRWQRAADRTGDRVVVVTGRTGAARCHNHAGLGRESAVYVEHGTVQAEVLGFGCSGFDVRPLAWRLAIRPCGSGTRRRGW